MHVGVDLIGKPLGNPAGGFPGSGASLNEYIARQHFFR